ncbi:uncharacterized protein PAC_04714 [Phialocephala subalpina]|uniref:Uncharacterized protein n=1 Tax=Phialocephala subalpina TaxID=576137 RepID=A0A1L7WPX2_9HELO|nr:uncharacterized protein PAC_04714 [Phialocephala subalpina]
MAFVPHTRSRLRHEYKPSKPIPVESVHQGPYRRLVAPLEYPDSPIDALSIDLPAPTASPTWSLTSNELTLLEVPIAPLEYPDSPIDDIAFDLPDRTPSPTLSSTIYELALPEVPFALEYSEIEMPSTNDPPASRLPTPKVGRVTGPPRLVDVQRGPELPRVQGGAKGLQLNKELPPQPGRRTSGIPIPIKLGVEKPTPKSQTIKVINEGEKVEDQKLSAKEFIDDENLSLAKKATVEDDNDDTLSFSDGDSIMAMTDEQRRATMYGISAPNVRCSKDADVVIMGGSPGSLKRKEKKEKKTLGGMVYSTMNSSSKTINKGASNGFDKNGGMGTGFGDNSGKTADKGARKGFDKHVGMGMGMSGSSRKTMDNNSASKGFDKYPSYVGSSTPTPKGIDTGRRATTANVRQIKKNPADVAAQFRSTDSNDRDVTSRMNTDHKNTNARRTNTEKKAETKPSGLKSRMSAMLNPRCASGALYTPSTLNADERFNASLCVLGSEIDKFRAKTATAKTSAQAKRFTDIVQAHCEGVMLVNQARVVRLQAMAMMDTMAMDEVRSVAEAIQSVHNMTAELEK